MRRALPALSLVALSVAAAPAAADPLPPYTPTTLTITATTTGLLVGYAEGTDDAPHYMGSTCGAVVTGAVAATVIEECRLYSAGEPMPAAHPAGAPGNATASAFGEVVGWGYTGPRPGDHLCVTAYTIPLHAPDAPLRLGTCTVPDEVDAQVWTPSQSGTASRTW